MAANDCADPGRATGIWPLLDIESFQDVTGSKTDLWLVRTVGVLVAVIDGVVLLADAAAEVGLAVLWGWGRLRR